MIKERTMINAKLYDQLRNAFGKSGVAVEKAGLKGDFSYKLETTNKYSLVKHGVDVGEEFRVNCPFCGDKKRRLYINHLWGTKSSVTGKLVLWLAHCFNEECLTDFDNRKDLYDMVYGDQEVPDTLDIAQEEVVETPIEPLDPPGLIVPLTSLIQPYSKHVHAAIQWCYDRNYDPAYLENMYGVGYCSVSRNANAKVNNRLFVPVYHDINGKKEMVAWTARRVDNDPIDTSPKWVHSFGTIGRFLCGLHTAKDYETIVITEGPGDAWSVGPNAVSVLGKTVQSSKVKLINAELAKRPASVNSSVILLLDPMQDEKAIQKRLPHHMVVAEKVLRAGLNCPVTSVYLPSYADPGSLDQDFIWACIRTKAEKDNVRVSRRKWQ